MSFSQKIIKSHFSIESEDAVKGNLSLSNLILERFFLDFALFLWVESCIQKQSKDFGPQNLKLIAK